MNLLKFAPIPLINIEYITFSAFFSATFMANSCAPTSTNALLRYAITTAQLTQPKKFDSQETVQLRIKLFNCTCPPNTDATKINASPVNNSADVNITAISPYGNNTAPRTPPPTVRYNCPADAIYIPAMKDCIVKTFNRRLALYFPAE